MCHTIYQLLFLGVLIRNWSNEKFIEGGTICFPGIGTMIDLASIRKSHGPVHFAGTEVSAKFTGKIFEKGIFAKICCLFASHTDLDGPIVSKKLLLPQNGLQLNKKCLKFILGILRCHFCPYFDI